MDDKTLAAVTASMANMHLTESAQWERWRKYLLGQAGKPDLKEGAAEELKNLALIANKNVISVVVDSFAQNLSVADYRDPSSDKSASAWDLWQSQRMDARQAEVHRGALTYGTSYVVVLPDGDGGVSFRPRSPRQLIAVYEDPQVDEWPKYALETWVEHTGKKQVRRGLLLDDENGYPVDLGDVLLGAESQPSIALTSVSRLGAPKPHGAGVCPVVRFVARRDSEGVPMGEVAPLVTLQRAINAVNLDRLIVSRWGAFPQKVISGWAPESVAEGLRATATDVWTFDSNDVKAQSFATANVVSYNDLLTEMQEHVAMVAQISPAAVTGKMVNLSAEALAAGEANQQRKLVAMRESLGVSHQQLLELGARMVNKRTAPKAEIFWRDTEARSIGAVVDAVAKLTAAGAPLAELLSMVPGLSAGTVSRVRAALAEKQESPQSPPENRGFPAQEAGSSPGGTDERTAGEPDSARGPGVVGRTEDV